MTDSDKKKNQKESPVSEKEVNALFENARDKFNSFMNVCVSKDREYTKMIHSRKLTSRKKLNQLSETDTNDKNKQTKSHIEKQLKQNREAILLNNVIPKNLQLILEKSRDVLKSDINKTKKGFEDTFKCLSSKSARLTEKNGLLNWYISWDHLGIMADLNLRKTDRGKANNLGFDKLKEDSIRLEKINKTISEKLESLKSYFKEPDKIKEDAKEGALEKVANENENN